MKKFRKLFTVLAASALVGAMPFTTMANPNINMNSGSASITVTLPGLPKGSTATNVYKVYRVFDATSDGINTNISYKLNNNHTDVPAGFKLDNGNVTYVGTGENGQLTQDDIKAIKEYVKDDEPVATVNTTAEDDKFTLTGLPYGYYYISTTTGTLVTVNSTNPVAEVQDKNEVPTLDKKITGVTVGSLDDDGKKALAQVGATVHYASTIIVGKGAEGYVFHDDMGSGLKLVTSTITVDDNDKDVAASDIKYNLLTNTADDTIYIEFDDTYIGKLAVGKVITISYDATVTSDALTIYQNGEGKNTASLDYGHSTGTNSTPTKETEIHNAQLTVKKIQPGDGPAEQKPLAGAGFVIKNEAGKYYKYSVDETTNKASVTWAVDIGDATEHVSGDDGKVPAFTGLSDGKYTLVEKTTPAGYNTAEDFNFEIVKGDYSVNNLVWNVPVLNEKGIELPSTGGMGTVAFAVVGLIVMAGAAVTLIIKKRA